MKNTVIIDLNKDEIADILCEKSEDNSITLKFINAKSEGSNAGVEFYKPQTFEEHVECAEISEVIEIVVPSEYYNDGHIMHFRFVSTNKIHKFFHILGNASIYSDVQIIQTSSDILTISGAAQAEENPDEPIFEDLEVFIDEINGELITGTIYDKLDYLRETKNKIKQAIITKGQTIDDDVFRDYANKILNISSAPTVEYVTNETFNSSEDAKNNVFSNSIYSDDRAPYKAFNGNTSDFWSTAITEDQNGLYIGYNFLNPIYNATINLTISKDNVPSLSFKFQGCKDVAISDESIWDDLTEEINISGYYLSKTTYTYYLKNKEGYSAYRLYITSGRQGSSYGWPIYEFAIGGTSVT